MRYKIKSIPQMLRLPALCCLCNQYHRGKFALCALCRALLTPLGPACQHCARPIPAGDFLICGPCCQQKPAVDHVSTAYQFEEPLRTLLHTFKYHDGLYLSSFLTSLILDAKPHDACETECFIPIPMHPRRLRHRGFNQAAVLARNVGRALARPCELSLCHKVVNTVPQAGLNAKQRQKNLQDVFQSAPMPYQHVTLVDDLLTTGNTANELARTLKNNGVAHVDLWCCARVP